MLDGTIADAGLPKYGAGLVFGTIPLLEAAIPDLSFCGLLTWPILTTDSSELDLLAYFHALCEYTSIMAK